MNRLLMAALAAAAFAPALAFSAQMVDPAVPRSLSDTPMDPPTLIQGAPAVSPPRPMKNVLAAQHDVDARQCLALPTNRAVHRCAERYRSHASRVRARAAKAAKAAPPSADVKPEIAKPFEAPKAALAAKGADTAPKSVPAAKGASEPPKTSDVIKLPPLKPVAPVPAEAPKAATPAKGAEPAKK